MLRIIETTCQRTLTLTEFRGKDTTKYSNKTNIFLLKIKETL